MDFLDAIGAVLDPDRIEDDDGRFVYSEERTQIIGMAAKGILFVVVAYRGTDVPDRIGTEGIAA